VSRYIDEHRGRFGVEPICRALGVSASAYFQRKSGRRPARQVEDERLLGRIELHAANYHAYRPRTNGKAERFIQTLSQRWAHGAIYGSSHERTAALPGWLTHYNFHRRHGSLAKKPPATRLAELTNLTGNYS